MTTPAVRTLKLRLISLAAALAASIGIGQAAAPAIPAVIRVFIVEVPPAQDHAFNVGVKAWWKCLRDHGTKQTSYAYDAETGDTDRYLFMNVFSSWGEMDVHDPAAKACDSVMESAVAPHATRTFSEVAELNAKATYLPGGNSDPAPLIWIDSYRIKTEQEKDFRDAVAKFTAAAAKAQWEGHYAGYDISGAGQGGEDFVTLWPIKSWANAGHEPSPSANDLMIRTYGKAATEANHKKFLLAISQEWSDIWSYDKDLTLLPVK